MLSSVIRDTVNPKRHFDLIACKSCHFVLIKKIYTQGETVRHSDVNQGVDNKGATFQL